MLYAVIDIGSSIIKYKIYEYSEGKIEPVIIHDKTTGLISYRKDNILTDEGIEVLLNTLKELKKYSDKLHVDKSYYVATASLRNVKNKNEVLDLVKKSLNINITVYTGEEEAKHSFHSLRWIDLPCDEGIFVDIGGGSSEITIFEDTDKILEQKSIPIGVLTIFNEYVSLLYPTKEEQQNIIKETLKRINNLKINDFSMEYLYGIGKTFVTLKRLFEHLKVKTDKNNLITIEQVDFVLDKLSTNSKENYKPALQVDSERVHTIIPSLLITKALSIRFNIKKIYVCDVTLQDGIIFDIIEKNQ
ncbi:exopolyphosphatase [Methanosphaera sp.]|uniref:Ppx/GppA phosphatase family protein n=1 Tax=Methanosphaera sp. TaxID=2666342 RepID=UPI0025EE1294|nr:exopolyphosphatase [Methanosphaera sp.]